MYNLYLARRNKELKIFLPFHGINLFKNFFYGTYIFPEKWPFLYELSEMPTQLAFDEVEIFSFQNRHLYKVQELAQKYQVGTDAYGFRLISSGGKKIMYSSDYFIVEDLEELLRETDYAIVECSHSPIENIFTVAKRAGVKNLIVNHIPPEVEARQKEYLTLAESLGIENTVFSYDGWQVKF
jgi:ribonuclease BN (tRNA processing enzyme)